MTYKPFFRREAEANGEIPDVWTYDTLPTNVRVQIWQTFGSSDAFHWILETSKGICNFLRHEIGMERLSVYTYYYSYQQWDYTEELKEFFINKDFRLALSVVECIAIALNKKANTSSRHKNAIDDINYRLKEARIGYEFNTDANMLIKKSDEAVYQLSIEPAFHLLSDLKFKESIDNFAKAFSDYQSGTTKDLENAITNALKALESTIKNICKLKGYEFNEEKPLKDQVAVLKNKKFLPEKYSNYFDKITDLITAVATPRNKTAGHGQSDEAADTVDEKLVEFVLAQVASVIVFLTKNLK